MKKVLVWRMHSTTDERHLTPSESPNCSSSLFNPGVMLSPSVMFVLRNCGGLPLRLGSSSMIQILTTKFQVVVTVWTL